MRRWYSPSRHDDGNSWGCDWADNGYALVSPQWMRGVQAVLQGVVAALGAQK